MKFKELRAIVDDIYIDLRFPPHGLFNEFNTRSGFYDEYDVLSIRSEKRLIVYLNWVKPSIKENQK